MNEQSGKISILLACTMVFIVSAFYSCAGTKNMQKDTDNVKEYKETNSIPGEYIVTFKDDGEKRDVEDIFGVYSVLQVDTIRDNIFLVKVERDPGIDIMRTEYIGKKGIVDIQPNYEYDTKPPKEGMKKIEPE